MLSWLGLDSEGGSMARVILAALLAAATCFACIITVDDDGPVDFVSIQLAIDGSYGSFTGTC